MNKHKPGSKRAPRVRSDSTDKRVTRYHTCCDPLPIRRVRLSSALFPDPVDYPINVSINIHINASDTTVYNTAAAINKCIARILVIVMLLSNYRQLLIKLQPTLRLLPL